MKSKVLALLLTITGICLVAAGETLSHTPVDNSAIYSMYGAGDSHIPAFYRLVDTGLTLKGLGLTILAILAIQYMFRVGKKSSIFLTPQKFVIYLYAHLSFLLFAVLYAVLVNTEYERGYYPIDADSIGIPIISMGLMYILGVGFVQGITWSILRKYRAGLPIYNPFGKSSVVSKRAKVWFCILTSLMLLVFVSGLVDVDFSSVVFSLLALVCITFEFFGTSLAKKKKSRKKAQNRS